MCAGDLLIYGSVTGTTIKWPIPTGVGHFIVNILTILSFQINQVAHHFVGGGDDLGVGLEAALDGNHSDEFLGQIHIGLLK